jgi:cyclase
MADMVKRVAEEVFMPLTVGGGIRTLEDATMLIQAGAEKISINSAAVKNPDLVQAISRRFGACATVVNIDPRRTIRNGRQIFEVHIQGGRHPTGLEAVAWAIEMAQRGAGELIVTSMDADGTRNGYDLPVTRAVADMVRIPVVASGGAGTPSHLEDALTVGGASAVLAASIFHYGEYPIPVVKKFLADRGIPVRMPA